MKTLILFLVCAGAWGQMVDVPMFEIPKSTDLISGIGWASTCAMSASGDKCAFVLQSTNTGTISKVVFATRNVTVADTLKIGLYTVDGSGDPTATAYGGSASVTQASPAANTSYTVTLGTPANSTLGDIFAVVIEFNSYASGNLQIAFGYNDVTSGFPYSSRLSSSTWTKYATKPAIALGYGDGSYSLEFSHAFGGAISSTTLSSGNVGGNVFTLPFAIKCTGMWAMIDNSAGVDYAGKLYSVSGSTYTEIASVAFDGDVARLSARAMRRILFSSPVVLAANQKYAVGISSSGSSVTIHKFPVPTAAAMSAYTGSSTIYSTLYTGSWAETTTALHGIGILVTAVGVGTGGFAQSQ